MKEKDLWPPLSQIQSEIQCDVKPTGKAGGSGRLLHSAPVELSRPVANFDRRLHPLEDWLRRRQAASRAVFSADWSGGHLIGVSVTGCVFGVLLDRCIRPGFWRGWLTAPECDWAGHLDVLLEPDDEPWDPVCGMVQTWNCVNIKVDAGCPVLGVLTASRLAGIRLVQQESESGKVVAISPRPGHIALRRIGLKQAVLTGTPLAPQDIRWKYQQLYRQVALCLQG